MGYLLLAASGVTASCRVFSLRLDVPFQAWSASLLLARKYTVFENRSSDSWVR